jgi:5-methylcytosine-specific restriction enzyme subunit McrC
LTPWKAGDSLLELREHETAFAEEALIEQFQTDVWKTLGLGVSKSLGGPEGLWAVAADRYVGVARLKHQQGTTQLRIKPKVDADLFFLADYAFGAERDLLRDEQLRADLNVMAEDPAACLLAWYLAELESFVRRWLRRDYVLKRDTFNGRVRGRLLVSDYARRFVATGQPHRTPCQLFELTPDNLPNRILKAALRHVARLALQLPLREARTTLRRRVDRLLPTLGNVSDVKITPDDYRRLQLRGALRHYGRMIEKSRAMLEGLFVTEELGPRPEDAFLWDMSVLFEAALRGALGMWPDGQLTKRPASARILDPDGARVSSSAVKPDFVVNTVSGRLVLDAKYKEAFSTRGADDAEISIADARLRVRRSDIYQVVSYANHVRLKPSVTGLIYPVALQADESLPGTYWVGGFSNDVAILFFDVGAHARENLPLFYAALNELAGVSATSAAAA